MADNTTSKTITLKSSEGRQFDVSEEVAKMSQTICHIIEDDCTEGFIPIPNVTAKTLSMVIEYCKKHVEAEEASKTGKPQEGSTTLEDSSKTSVETLENWDKEFVEVDQAELFDLIMAANYLNIKELLDLTCQKVADMMKGKSLEEIRQIFHIQNDFNPEEEEEVRREHQWAFD